MVRRSMGGRVRRIGAALFVAILALPVMAPAAGAWDATVEGLQVTHVKLDGLGGQVTVAPGALVTVDLDYVLADRACPGCVDQIQLGFHDGGVLTCAYDEIPGDAPGVSGHAQVTLTAPSTPGPHFLVVDLGRDYGCPTEGTPYAHSASSYDPAHFIGRVNVGTNAVILGTTRISRVSINGGSSDVRVKAGSLLTVSFRFSANLFRTVEVGWAHRRPVRCVDGGSPTAGHPTAGTRTVKLRAPAAKGSWMIAIDPNVDSPGCDFHWASTPLTPEQQFIAHVTTR